MNINHIQNAQSFKGLLISQTKESSDGQTRTHSYYPFKDEEFEKIEQVRDHHPISFLFDPKTGKFSEEVFKVRARLDLRTDDLERGENAKKIASSLEKQVGRSNFDIIM